MALRNYQREYDDDQKVFKAKPLHNWASHPSDAARYLALAYVADNPAARAKNVLRAPTLEEVYANQRYPTEQRL